MAPKPMHMLYTWAYDDVVWGQRLAQVRARDLCVVIGPNSGPPQTETERQALVPRIQQLRDLDAVVFGYTPITRGARLLMEFSIDIDEWAAVGIWRLFADEFPYDRPEASTLLSVLRAMIRPRFGVEDPGVMIIANAGAPYRWWIPSGCVVVTHEDAVPPSRVPVLGRREACIVHSQSDPAAVRAVLDSQPWYAVSVRRDGVDGNAFDGVE